MTEPVPLLAEGLLQEYFLQAIFRSLIDDQKIRTDNGSNRDSTLAGAEGFLLMGPPDGHIAVVLETGSEDPEKIRETDEDGRWRLERSFPSGRRWKVALAIPDLTAWALIDDHVRQEYEKIRQDPNTASTPEERAKIEQLNYYKFGMQIRDWVAVQPFDLETLKQRSRQVRELCTFIEESLHYKPKRVPATAAEWF
jgi:hypothetical protein